MHPSHPHLGEDSYGQTHQLNVDNEVVAVDDDGQWLKARADALRNATIGGGLLLLAASVRILIFKI
jgi:hypothetical protein